MVVPEFRSHASTDFQTVNQIITKDKNDPSYRVKSKMSNFTVVQ